MFKVLDLFSGIGGFSLGLERTGCFKTIAFCEIEQFCQRVLKKHWPEVPCYDDIRELTAERLRADGIVPSVLCGGFPCQDISIAGSGEGLDGERSGLWFEYFRLIGEIRPRFALIENTPTLLGRGLSRVLCDLASCGYDAQWDVISAKSIGAQHLRERIWIVAYPHSDARRREYLGRDIQSQAAACIGKEQRPQRERLRARHGDILEDDIADVVPSGLSRGRDERADSRHASYLPTRAGLAELAPRFDRSYWRYQPLLGRRIYGVSNRVDRVGSLGNAVLPQIPEIIGRAILAAT